MQDKLGFCISYRVVGGLKHLKSICGKHTTGRLIDCVDFIEVILTSRCCFLCKLGKLRLHKEGDVLEQVADRAAHLWKRNTPKHIYRRLRKFCFVPLRLFLKIHKDKYVLFSSVFRSRNVFL